MSSKMLGQREGLDSKSSYLSRKCAFVYTKGNCRVLWRLFNMVVGISSVNLRPFSTVGAGDIISSGGIFEVVVGSLQATE